MKKIVWFALGVILLCVSSCGKSKQKRIQEINSYRDQIETKGIASTSEADSVIKLYVTFADDFPNDSLTPFYLLDAADVAMNVNYGPQAIEFLDRIIANYPSFSDMADVYFFKGFVYDNNMYELDKAVEAYRLFLEKYPDHTYAKDAKALIENINLSPEEMIQKLMNSQSMAKDSIAS